MLNTLCPMLWFLPFHIIQHSYPVQPQCTRRAFLGVKPEVPLKHGGARHPIADLLFTPKRFGDLSDSRGHKPHFVFPGQAFEIGDHLLYRDMTKIIGVTVFEDVVR